MITKYKLFLEHARFSDISKYSGLNDDIKHNIEKEFKDDTTLISSVYIEYYNKTIFLKWFNTTEHSIKERIKTRTTIKSVSEFNELIKESIINLIKNHFKEIEKENDDYYDKIIAVKIPNIELYIIIYYEPRNLYNKYTIFSIKTIVQNIDERKIDHIIYLK